MKHLFCSVCGEPLKRISYYVMIDGKRHIRYSPYLYCGGCMWHNHPVRLRYGRNPYIHAEWNRDQ